MRVICNKIIPFGKKFYAINLFGIIFVKGPYGEVILNHEKIHTAQIKELYYIFFYIFYILEWFVRSVQYKSLSKGYYNISFEREAYAHERNMSYLSVRHRYNFFNYVCKK